jgi:hypothetical protein
MLAETPSEFKTRITDRPRVMIALGVVVVALVGLGVALGSALGGDDEPVPVTANGEFDPSEFLAAADERAEAAHHEIEAAKHRIRGLESQIAALRARVANLRDQTRAAAAGTSTEFGEASQREGQDGAVPQGQAVQGGEHEE